MVLVWCLIVTRVLLDGIAHYIVLMALDFADGKTWILMCFGLHEVSSGG
jgi:hypothetical protein